jgi:phenylpyruvate tautomerase PptA (4-oxalocrotonate tautomerase family)
MPIVTIECVVNGNFEPYDTSFTQRLADRLGVIFKSEPGTTWVKLKYLAPSNYAENDVSTNGSMEPTFVSILLRSLPSEATLERIAQNVSTEVSSVLARPSMNTHVFFEPEGLGRVAFGGVFLKKA